MTWDYVNSFPIKPLQARYDYEFWPVAASPNPDQFYIYADRDDEVSAAIKLYDINENRVVKTLFQDPNWDVDAVFTDTYSHDYLGVQYYKDTLTFEMKDPEIQAKLDTLIEQFGGKSNVDIQQFNMYSQSALVYVSAPNNPGEYFHYDLKAETLSFLFPTRPSLDGLLLTETDALTVATRDGTELRAYLTRPEGTSADKPLPLIVLPHDGPEERDFCDYNRRVQYFANRGYQVLQVNFRGSSGYGNAFTEAGFGEWGGVIQTDLMDAVQHLYDQGIAAPNNSCIVGIGSFGGFAALSAAAFTPDMFSCVVAEGGAADLTGVMKETGKNYSKQSAAYEYWVKFIGDPNVDKDRLDAASPINNAANIQAPIFFSDISTSAFSMNGTNSLYTMFQSDKMMRALKKNNKTFSEIKQRDLPHEKEPTLENDLYAWQRIDAFLAEHLTQ